MSDTVIKVENLSKKYILSHQSQEKYTALRDVMANGVKNLGKKLLSPFTSSTSLRAGLHSSHSSDSPFTASEDFYALRDVSFEIKQGDRVGIIGRNGAGKSTLLKILSRITEPTSGRIEITGRVASLLEVGTGFHPELTGRENIFLNGAILGMGKAEIKRKFDEIVAFAEVERFLDTPVKRYSSGMYVRLAFAVAAHLEPEILIVDEVLAVGDAQFQKKCLGKMEEVGREGRTVLFVSHQMESISNLCDRSILLAEGKVAFAGNTNDVVTKYLENFVKKSASLAERLDRKGDGKVRYLESWVENGNGKTVSTVKSGDKLVIVLKYKIIDPTVKNIKFSISISSVSNINISLLDSNVSGDFFVDPMPEEGVVDCVLVKTPLNVGSYYYNISIHSSGVLEDWLGEAGVFDVVGGDFYGTGLMPDRSRLVLLEYSWSSNRRLL